MKTYPGVHTICGLSNISYGLPARQLINRSFFALCMASGLSAVIMDPTDQTLMATCLSIEMLLGRDAYCENFIDAYQNGRLIGK
jgi:5-methyltetrahydrofolate--homocysteine methyltransferase